MKCNLRVAVPPQIPLVAFNAECNFCQRLASWIQFRTGDAVQIRPFKSEALIERHAELTILKDRTIHFLETDGAIYTGSEAVFRALAHQPSFAWLLRSYERFPTFAALTEHGCDFLIAHPKVAWFLSFLVLSVQPPAYGLTRSVFLRVLGLIYLCAFISLATQVIALVGSRGIQPAHQLIDAARQQLGGFSRFLELPTLCWISASDRMIQWQCFAGVFLSFVLVAGIAPVVVIPLLWVLYLSLTSIGGVFMGFQWENLLLESGFLAIFLAPIGWNLNSAQRVPTIPLWLLRWLVFRLHFQSGCVKLISGDPAWSNLTALQFHYETQPLPTWIGWYFQQLPGWFHVVSALLMFAVEFGVACLVLGPRPCRIAAAIVLIAFQLILAVTGNYGFFNFLSMTLCLALLDDFAVRRIGRAIRLRGNAISSESVERSRGRNWPAFVTMPMCLFVLLITTIQIMAMFRPRFAWPGFVRAIYSWQQPFRSINRYGLFAVMTTTRPEIIIEGSNDQTNWRPYEFRFKAGDLKKRPRFVAPHQPRLDWQMWFAALGDYRQNPWFIEFCTRLLEGSSPVQSLMAGDPFPQKPPRYLRALRYEYSFTDVPTRRRTGEWWRREFKGNYCPILFLRERAL